MNSSKQPFAIGTIIIPNKKPRNLKEYSVQFSSSVVSDSLQPHEPQHTRPPCLNQSQKDKDFPPDLYEVSRRFKFLETENNMMVARRSREQGVKSPGFQFFMTKSFGDGCTLI